MRRILVDRDGRRGPQAEAAGDPEDGMVLKEWWGIPGGNEGS